MVALTQTLKVYFPGAKINRTLTSNSHAHWKVKAAVARATKANALTLCRDALYSKGISAGQFLTDFNRFEMAQALPLRLIVVRYYSGHSQQMDRDNLITALKYHQDAVARVLEVDDKHIVMSAIQTRKQVGHWLEAYIVPAWAEIPQEVLDL